MNGNIACNGRIPFSIFVRANGFPRLMEKNEWVCLIYIEGCPSLIRLVFISKNILIITIKRWLQRKNKGNLKNKKIQKIAGKRYCLSSSFYPLGKTSLKVAK